MSPRSLTPEFILTNKVTTAVDFNSHTFLHWLNKTKRGGRSQRSTWRHSPRSWTRVRRQQNKEKNVRSPRLLLLGLFLFPWQTQAQSAACTGHFLNPLSDICWDCLFPMTLGSVPLISSSYPDTANPSMPISYFPKPRPFLCKLA